MGLRVLEAADELWLCCSRISEGMCAEIAAAKRLGIPVKEIPESEIQGGIDMDQYGVWGGSQRQFRVRHCAELVQAQGRIDQI